MPAILGLVRPAASGSLGLAGSQPAPARPAPGCPASQPASAGPATARPAAAGSDLADTEPTLSATSVPWRVGEKLGTS